MIKNVSGQSVGAQMTSATDGSDFTGSVTVHVTIDRGTQTVGSVGSGACAHEGKGVHTYAPAQAETDGDFVQFTFEGSGAVTQTVQVYTRAATPDVNVASITAGAIAAASFAAGAFDAVWTVGTRTLTSFGSLVSDIWAGVVDSSGVTTLLARLTATRAGYLDNLDGHTPQTGDSYPIVSSIEADTQDLQTRLPAALTGDGNMKSDVLAISGDAAAADALESYLDGSEFMPVDAHKPNFSVSGGTLTVKQPDGSTTAYTKTITTDPSAEPITGAS